MVTVIKGILKVTTNTAIGHEINWYINYTLAP